MDFKKLDEQAKAADGFLSTVGTLLKKHWWVLILILLGWLFWWGWNNPEEDTFQEEYYDTLYQDDYDIIE